MSVNKIAIKEMPKKAKKSKKNKNNFY